MQQVAESDDNAKSNGNGHCFPEAVVYPIGRAVLVQFWWRCWCPVWKFWNILVEVQLGIWKREQV